MMPPKSARLVPTYLTFELTKLQRDMMKLLARNGTAPIQLFQEKFELNRAAARRAVGELVNVKLVEAVRDGRGQAFRLA